jgi:hypothetical protein
MKDLDFYHDWLVEMGIATHEEIQLVSNINGWNIEMMESILYARTAYRSYEQYNECN